MAILTTAFDATTVEPRSAPEPMPIGDHHGQIIASEWKPTQSGRGRYLEILLEVMSGPYARRRTWDRLNLDNASEQAVEIARRTLSAICHAVGCMRVTDTAELHFRDLVFSVGPQKNSQTGQTEVKGYKKFDGNTPAATRPQPRPSAPAGRPAPAAAPQYGQPTPQYGQPAPQYAQQPAPRPQTAPQYAPNPPQQPPAAPPQYASSPSAAAVVEQVPTSAYEASGPWART